jgi:hypothetical protein
VAKNQLSFTLTGKDSKRSPEEELQVLAAAAVTVSAKARKHRQSLSGSVFYANKLADLRSSAVISLKKLSFSPANDVRQLEALSSVIFADTGNHSDRVIRCRELVHELKTKSWSSGGQVEAEVGLFPISVLRQTRFGYMVNVGVQMNGCFNSGWCDAAAVMLRRLIETAIIETFEAHKLDAKIRNPQGDFFQLTELVSVALGEGSWNLSRNTKRALPKIKDVGHRSAHSRRYNAHKSELEALMADVQVVIQEFLHLAKLL